MILYSSDAYPIMAKKDIKISFLITPRLNERLETYADSVEKTKSEVLRDLVEDYIPEKPDNSTKDESKSQKS